MDVLILTVTLILLFSKSVYGMSPCPRLACREGVICSNGYARDERGCPTCDCLGGRGHSSQCSEENLHKPMVCSPEMECRIILRGCEIRQPRIACDPIISYECLPICPVLKCPECPSGYKINEFGCKTCACKNPCEGVECPPGFTCRVSKNQNGNSCVTPMRKKRQQYYQPEEKCICPLNSKSLLYTTTAIYLPTSTIKPECVDQCACTPGIGCGPNVDNLFLECQRRCQRCNLPVTFFI